MNGPVLQPASPSGSGPESEVDAQPRLPAQALPRQDAQTGDRRVGADLEAAIGAGLDVAADSGDGADGARAGRSARVARRLEVRGTVQGVGFRPFVCRVARELGLDGQVRNAGDQVVVDAAGDPDALAALVHRLSADAPKHAVVSDVTIADLDGNGPAVGTGFRIAVTAPPPSKQPARPDDGWLPDLPTCPDCLRELFDPDNRRHRYAFVDCDACGPRASITDSLPFERSRTTMVAFPMCLACTTEYADPASRRHGAELASCHACGPRLSWRGTREGDLRDGEDALAAAVEMLAAGGVVAVKGVGGYHLVCDATAPRAVARLRSRKRHWSKPLAVLAADIDMARSLARLSFADEQLLESAPRPIVVSAVRRKDLPIAAGVSPGMDRLGLCLPSSPLLHLLAHDVDRPLVLTSGNRADEPVAYADDDAFDRLDAVADGFLGHDRAIRSRAEDSVAWVVAGGPAVVRRGRGYAPAPLRLPVPTRRPLLAVGAQLDHTCALAQDGRVVVSQHLGDLADTVALQAFENTLADLSALTSITPQVVVHDLHPGYLSTQYAQRRPAAERRAVQHHHAHVASCAAEHEVDGAFIGIAYDGLGLGDDGTLWGGEVLVGDLRSYRRVGRFGAVPLPGGEAAVRRPARSALGCLLGGERLGGAPIAADLVAAYTKRLPERELDTVLRMVRAGVNTPLTTSAARLFDAAASILGLRDDAAYEGEGAMVLEGAARGRADSELPWRIVTEGGLRVFDPTPTMTALLVGMVEGAPVSSLAAGFHATLATVTAALCLDVRRDTGVRTVCLSGSVFTNHLLTTAVVDALGSEGFEVFVNERVPTNDGGISYGQAAVAAAQLA